MARRRLRGDVIVLRYPSQEGVPVRESLDQLWQLAHFLPLQLLASLMWRGSDGDLDCIFCDVRPRDGPFQGGPDMNLGRTMIDPSKKNR
jgi:hypothetical protein